MKYDVQHHIETTGPPVSARPRQLAPDSLKVAKRVWTHVPVKYHPTLLQCLVFSLSTWCPRKHLAIEDRAVTTVLLTTPPHLTGTLYPTFMIFPPLYSVLLSSPNLVQWLLMTFQRPAVTTPLGLFEFIKMTFGLRNAAQTSNVSWTNYSVVYLSPMHMWTMYSLQVPTQVSTFNIYKSFSND